MKVPRYQCPSCEKRWKGLGRPPGGTVHCPRCGSLVYTYAKARKPMRKFVPRWPR